MDKKGTYVAVTFSEDTVNKLEQYCEQLPINCVTSFHTTLVMTRKWCPDLLPLQYAGVYADLIGLSIWENHGRLDLVLLIDCPYLHTRSAFLYTTNTALPIYSHAIPHITLAYGISPDVNLDDLPGIESTVDKIEIIGEYCEELNLSWADNK